MRRFDEVYAWLFPILKTLDETSYEASAINCVFEHVTELEKKLLQRDQIIKDLKELPIALENIELEKKLAASEKERAGWEDSHDAWRERYEIEGLENMKLKRELAESERLLSKAVKIIHELQAMPDVCHLDDHFEFLNEVEEISKERQ